MFTTKSSEEIKIMAKGGKISRNILDEALRQCIPGKKLIEINNVIEDLILKNGVEPWFKEVNEYPLASIISVNEVWIHGIPDKYELKEGDVVSIDIGIKYDGFYLDNCWTVTTNPTNISRVDIRNAFDHSNPEITKFLQEGVKYLDLAISNFKLGNRVGDISASMQEIEKVGYSVIRDFTGHGVGYGPHEDPQIPCFGSFGAGPKLQKNMVLAIEIMYTTGGFETEIGADGWSISTKDKSVSAMFEHTVALVDNGPKILTL